MQVLNGHTSPETAYVVDSYPYGFRLRCKIRYWVETRKGYGQRVMSQTTNPKIAGEHWNKPKAGNYWTMAILVLNDVDHVETAAVHFSSTAENMAAFRLAYYEWFTTEQQRYFDSLEAVHKRANPNSWARLTEAVQ